MEKIQGIMRINMKLFGKKCNYCKEKFATHLNRKIHETMMHKDRVGSVECVIEPDNYDGTVVINPTKKYPHGKVYIWSHVHGQCKRDPCIFCGRGDLTEIKKEWGIEE